MTTATARLKEAALRAEFAQKVRDEGNCGPPEQPNILYRERTKAARESGTSSKRKAEHVEDIDRGELAAMQEAVTAACAHQGVSKIIEAWMEPWQGAPQPRR